MASPSTPPGCLFLVATPIGNLEDITLRALRTLESRVSLIAAEDTRRTRKLLTHYGIHTTTTSLHEHNESTKTPALLRRLGRGESVALVSDAGTPLLSDPGARLVREALAQGIRVEPVPGPSAVIAGLVMSGLAGGPFTFVGFPPSRSKDRKRWVAELAEERRTIVLFEAPHRIRATLRDLGEAFPAREGAICREITKAHEELVKGPINELSDRIKTVKGEFTVVIAPSLPLRPESSAVGKAQIWAEFCCLTKKQGVGRREAVRQIAQLHGLRPRQVYSMVESAKTESVITPKQ